MSDPRLLALGLMLVAFPAAANPQDPPSQDTPSATAEPSEDTPSAKADAVLPDLNAKASYGFGLNAGRFLAQQCQSLGIDAPLVARGVADALTEAAPLLSDEQIQEVMKQFEKTLLERQMKAEAAMAEENKQAAGKNKAEGDAYRAENAEKEGVRTTDSGLQYESLKAGDGPSPTLSDTVTIHYKGTLLDGTVFDSTEDRGPLTLPVGEFIEGWKQALQMMKVGDTWRVVIPPELGYGEDGTPGGPIPANATLIFEMELLGIADK